MHAKFWCGNLKERGHVGDLEADGRIILKLVLEKYDVRMRTQTAQNMIQYRDF
jgi:hypothetical protein